MINMEHIQLKIPAVFTDSFIHQICQLNDEHSNGKVTEVYGSLDESLVGNARISDYLPKVDHHFLAQYISLLQKHGVMFNYILNSTCIGNKEFLADSQKRLAKSLGQIVDLGIDSFTIANPFLIQLVKSNFPKIKIVASINFCADNALQLSQLMDLGADSIVLNRWVNRNFDLLKKLKQKTPAELELLVNSGCVNHCILHAYHNNVNSHASQPSKETREKAKYPKYPGYQCLSYKLKDVVRIICGSWIRPEDTPYYTEIGYNSFKTDLRGSGEEKIINIAKSYLLRKYEGNFLYLLLPTEDHPGLPLRKAMNMTLPNKSLEGYIRPFVKGKLSCNHCDGQNMHCKKFASYISYDDVARLKLIEFLGKEVASLVSRGI